MKHEKEGLPQDLFIQDAEGLLTSTEEYTMEYLLTAEEMAEADRRTSENIGIPSIVLMERAALAVADAVQTDFPKPKVNGRPIRIAILAGKGNNGADALAAGRILLDAGYAVQFYLTDRTKKSDCPSNSDGTGPAEDSAITEKADGSRGRTAMDTQLRILKAYGIEPLRLQMGHNEHANEIEITSQAAQGNQMHDSRCDLLQAHPDVIVDGLFGTGLSREVAPEYAMVIEEIRQEQEENGAKVYSVDIPSGISATTGAVMGMAVQADVTVTFSFYKRGHFLYPGSDYCGKLIRREIGITERAFAASGNHWPRCFTYLSEKLSGLLPARSHGGNKGTFGKVLVIAGSKGVSGACTMCAQAVLRSGAGMVRVYTHEDNRIILQETVPEAMCSTYCTGDVAEEQLKRDLAWADVTAIGPGIGLTEDGRTLLKLILQYGGGKSEIDSAASADKFCVQEDGKTLQGTAHRNVARSALRGLVIDADAIRLLAESDALYELLGNAGQQMPVILTPHAAECAALLHTSVADIKAKRFRLLPEFVQKYHCTIIGKDARTLVASAESEEVYLNTSGNNGLATAGSGDVLTGITAALLAQWTCAGEEQSGFRAACTAAYLHGRIADRLAKVQGTGSLTATDLLKEIRG